MGISGPNVQAGSVAKLNLTRGVDQPTLAAATGMLNAPTRARTGPDEAPLLQSGDVVSGRYEVVRELTEGGMGVVFQGTDRTTGSLVALKVVRPEFRAGTDLMRFRHEFYLMATLQHPRFVRVLDYAMTDGGLPCLIMEYVPGEDLHTLLPLPWKEAAVVLHQVCSALSFLHSRRYIHHDIKPGNVRVERSAADGTLQARLIDFGIMEPIGASTGRGWMGTPAYLPPEALFFAPTDHRLDLYALGVMAFEMLTGRVPFEMKDTESFLNEKQLEPPDVKSQLGHVPNDLAELIADLMSPDAADRPYDATVTLRRLRLAADLDLSSNQENKAPPYLHASRLVARDGAVEALLDAWLESVDAPRLAYVEAASGLGTSSVLREIQLRFRMQAGVTIAVSGHAGSGGFRVLRAILAELSPHADEELARRTALVSSLARIAPELLDRHPGMAPADPSGDATEDRRIAFDALREWFRALLEAERIAVLVDDAEHADVASLDALASLLADSELGGLLVVLGVSEQVDRSESALTRLLQNGTRVELPPFSEQDVGELLCALFGPVAPSPSLVAALTNTSRGNPSLLNQILLRLVDEGIIVFSDERWQLPRDIGAVPLPETLADAVSQRLQQLQPSARSVVEVLAVIDDEVPLDVLPELLELGERHVFEGIDQLIAAELVLSREDAYRLPPFVRGKEVANEVPKGRAVLFHRRFAELAEKRLGDGAAQHAAELWRHYRLGGVPAKARFYLAIACEKLFEAQALADAIAPLTELEKILVEGGAENRQSPDRALLFTTRQRLARVGLALDSHLAVTYFALEREMVLPGAATATLGSRSASGPHRRLHDAVALASLLAREMTAGQRSRGLGPLPDRLRRYFVATSYLAASLALRGSFERSLEVAESLKRFALTPRGRANGAYNLCRSIALVHQGRVEEAEQALSFSLDRMSDPKLSEGVPEMDHKSGLGGILTCLTLLHSARGRAEALDWLSRFESFVDEEDEKLRFLMPNLLLAQIDYHLHRGEVSMAREVERRYRAHRARVGIYNAHVEAQILVALARVTLAARNLVEAEALCADLRRRSPEDFFTHGWGACASGELWVLQRLFKRARSALSEALRYATRPNERSYKLELRALNALTELEIEERNPHAARRLGRRALALARLPECRSELEEMWALRNLTSVAILLGEHDVAHRRATNLEALAKEIDNPLFSAIAEKARSEVARALGKRDDATSHGALAAQLFERLGYVPSTLNAQNPATSGSHASTREGLPRKTGALSDALRGTSSSRSQPTNP